MKVMFVVSDYAGHYAPMVPLGWALQAAGHEVRLVCGPAHAPVAALTGLPTVAREIDIDTVVRARIGNHIADLDAGPRHPTLPPIHPITGARMAPDGFDWPAHAPDYLRQEAINGRDRTRAIAGFARSFRPDLIVYDLLSPEALVAAHAVGVPAICHLWGPTGTDEPSLPHMSPDIPPGIRDRLGIDLHHDLVPYVIDPCPPALAPQTRAARIPVRYVPYSGPSRATFDDRKGAPRIVAVWSTSLTRIFGPASFAIPSVIRAAAGLDADLIVAVAEADAHRLGPVPAGVRVRVLTGAPLSDLLRGADVVVHHGGAGCLMTTMAAGVPQLALPYGAEQELIADRLAASGAGLRIRGSAASVTGIRDALRTLLDEPGYPDAARSLAAENASAPTPAAVVARLAEIATTGARAVIAA